MEFKLNKKVKIINPECIHFNSTGIIKEVYTDGEPKIRVLLDKKQVLRYFNTDELKICVK